MRDLAITPQRVDALTPSSRNARTHSEKQIRQIADSITAFGWTNPILVDGAGGVIAGHGRLQAAKLLGVNEVPTICLKDMTEGKIRAYIIADNKLAENAGWDRELLAIELQGVHRRRGERATPRQRVRAECGLWCDLGSTTSRTHVDRRGLRYPPAGRGRRRHQPGIYRGGISFGSSVRSSPDGISHSARSGRAMVAVRVFVDLDGDAEFGLSAITVDRVGLTDARRGATTSPAGEFGPVT